MKIEVLIQGDPDITPYTETFHYEKSDEPIFVESAQLIKNRLSNNMVLNINETLRLFVAYIITSLNEHKSVTEIQKHIPDLLLSNQVMIGVPESIRKLTFTITAGDAGSKEMSISEPIHADQYFLHEQKPIVWKSEIID